MLRSMTGYGKGEAAQGGCQFTVEVKSVNSRFLEAGVKLPQALWGHEAEARILMSQAVGRGKVDVAWKETTQGVKARTLTVNKPLAREVAAALKTLSKELKLKEKLRLDQVARYPDVLQTAQESAADGVDPESRWACLRQALVDSLESLNVSREREGKALGEECRARLARCLELADSVEGHSSELIKAYRDKLARRLSELLEKFSSDDPRVLTEAAILAERADIREELVRFRIHVNEFTRLLGERGPVGKRLDFLTQELLRETNTMGSKSADAKVAHFVVELKGEIEKIKEQVQNLE
jgi:uncharacterized protein (TIGR00255 family)